MKWKGKKIAFEVAHTVQWHSKQTHTNDVWK